MKKFYILKGVTAEGKRVLAIDTDTDDGLHTQTYNLDGKEFASLRAAVNTITDDNLDPWVYARLDAIDQSIKTHGQAYNAMAVSVEKLRNDQKFLATELLKMQEGEAVLIGQKVGPVAAELHELTRRVDFLTKKATQIELHPCERSAVKWE